jgi:hypothetical protein
VNAQPPPDDVGPPGGRHAAHRTRPRQAKRIRPARRGAIALIGLVLTALIVAAGVVVGLHLTARQTPGTPRPSAAQASTQFSATLQRPVAAAPLPSTSGTPATPGSLQSDFEQLKAALDSPIGIALAPVGTGQPLVQLGDWPSGPAWSTMKVPLAITALRAEPDDPPTVTGPITAAITQSDNAAADTIWQSLGDPVTAASKIDDTLRETGDLKTTVQSQKVRPEFSAFGQTDWSLASQTQFLAAAACDIADKPILDLMGQITGDQRWGLGTIPGTRFKGGWGPSESNAYLVRQIGVVPVEAGEVVVAIAVTATSGAFADGTADLTEIADWLQRHAAALPAGQCPQ